MTEVTIRNKQLLDTLDGFVDNFFSIPEHADELHRAATKNAYNNPEQFCDDQYLQDQLAKGPDHSGYPEEFMTHPIGKMVEVFPDQFHGFQERVKYQFASEIGAHTSALLNYYPKGGFVGWHTNWNANAYQVLFTWSRTGDGYFKYLDSKTGEIVTIQDKPGWQCRHYYFGRDDEPEHHCWHAAYAGCDRITLAYKFVNKHKGDPQDAMAIAMRDQLIEEIETE